MALPWTSNPTASSSRLTACSTALCPEAGASPRVTANGGCRGRRPRDRLQTALDLLSSEMRRRSRERFELPDDESVLWELVSDKSWAGNAEYLGRRQTRIAINTDLPIGSHRLLELVCHEAYPGHHSEHACKDALGHGELSVFVYPTPQALLAEGIAECAVEALLGRDADQVAADCLRPAGIAYDAVTAPAVRQAETLLLPVRSNVALMLDEGATSAEAHDYAKTWWPFHEPDVIDKAHHPPRGEVMATIRVLLSGRPRPLPPLHRQR